MSAPSVAVVEYRTAFEAAVVPSVVAAPFAFAIVADAAAAGESWVLAPRLDAFPQTMLVEVVFHSEMSAEHEPFGTGERTAVATVVVVVVVAAGVECVRADAVVASAASSVALFGS